MSSSSQDILYEFLKKLEIKNMPKEIVEKLQVLLLSQSDVNHNDIINLIEESVSQIDND